MTDHALSDEELERMWMELRSPNSTPARRAAITHLIEPMFFAARSAPGWRAIESAPKDRTTEILVWCPCYSPAQPDRGYIFKAIWGYYFPNPKDRDDPEGPAWVDPDDFERLGEPTHWQPLPPPPHDDRESEVMPSDRRPTHEAIPGGLPVEQPSEDSVKPLAAPPTVEAGKELCECIICGETVLADIVPTEAIAEERDGNQIRKCTKCHHEWQGSEMYCDWCGGTSSYSGPAYHTPAIRAKAGSVG